MLHENFGNVFVDVCDNGCQGIWFDGDELARLDHNRKGGGPALQHALAAVAKPPTERPPTERPLSCPRCDVEMDTIDYELHQPVAVDSCPDCTGVFLDAGELALIRSRELTADEAQTRGNFRRRRGFRRRRLEREAAQRRRAAAALLFST